MIKVHNFKIDKIKNNSVVYISNAQADEMMFVCEFIGNKTGDKNGDKLPITGDKWILFSKEYGNYSPAFDSLEEMKELLQEDWLNGEITDIDVFDIEETENDNGNV